MLAYKTELLQGGGRVFLLCSKGKCFSIRIKMLCKSYFPLNFNLYNPSGPVFTACHRESGVQTQKPLPPEKQKRTAQPLHPRLPRLRSSTDLLARDDLHAPQKVFINFGFHSGERNGKEKTNSAVWENCFLVSSNTG